jgi:ABC-2 type transport system ATP-binding protein
MNDAVHDNAIRLSGVSKAFSGKLAVDQLDLTVPGGSIYGFIGPNGSGKTTTLRMILRIFQPDRGTVEVLGESRGKTADDRLGYLPEERGLYKRMKVGDLLRYYARLKGFQDCQDHINSWLDYLDARSWVNQRIDTLSKGMAQKIQFIAAVAARPRLVILDEPFSGLDPVNMESLRNAVLLLRERGTTVIFSTHDMDMAEKLCDTIFMIFRGRKVLDGTIDSIQSQYPANRLRVRMANPGIPLPHLPEVADVMRQGSNFRLTLQPGGDPSTVLSRLVAHGELHLFEVVKPSLHDIFIQIARPDPVEMAVP